MQDQTNSIFETAEVDTSSIAQLQSTSRWSFFIGIIYIILAALMVVLTVVIYANLDQVVNVLSSASGVSNEALEFLTANGKWVFLLMMLIVGFVLIINAIYLIRFRTSVRNFQLTNEEKQITFAFEHLTKYLMITTILSVISIALSVVAAVVYAIV
ncbi:MAG: hypothetical protein JNJ58_03750 [Chitinophagaceae bacterium]|nr:hypothetical protein [Chitinophagaceae bacterium]